MPKIRYVRGVSGAAQEITRRLGKHSAFTGMDPCAVRNRLVVYRVPGNETFETAVRKVAGRWDIVLVLVDTKYSRAALENTRRIVASRAGALAAKDADLVAAGIFNDGYLLVSVEDHVSAARQILADLGDRIEVGRLERSAPLSA